MFRTLLIALLAISFATVQCVPPEFVNRDFAMAYSDGRAEDWSLRNYRREPEFGRRLYYARSRRIRYE